MTTMTKPLLLMLAGWHGGLAAWLILAPRGFYDLVPGVAETGPFNDHFARDVGFAFLVTAVGLALAVWRDDRVLGLLAAGFPALHGLLHLVSVGHHGAGALDLVANTGLGGLALVLAARLKGGAA